jgi:serine/threonine protein kinase
VLRVDDVVAVQYVDDAFGFTMTGLILRKWRQVKRTLWAGLPVRLRKGAQTNQRPNEGGSPHERQNDGQTPTSKSTADFPGSSTVATLHRSSPARHVQSLPSGQIVAGRFEILRFLNSGGMGEVYEAWDSDLKERIALKTIRPEIASSPSAIDLFKSEVKQARVVSHVNVCRVYEAFSHELSSGDRIWFLTMELLEGQTLSEYLRQHGTLPPAEALELIEQMVAGLAAAHELGIVHRDFKSSNVMLVAGEHKTRAVVTDFGLSLKVLSELSVGRGGGEGTRHYRAPEQERGGPVGSAADQYSLGVVICEMLTGRLPVRPVSGGRVLLPPGRLSPKWEAAIRRCLEFRPEERFEKVIDVVSALNPRKQPKSAWISVGGLALTGMMVVAALTVAGRRGGSRLEKVTQLTPGTDFADSPSLSRDGKIVAYSSNRAEAGNVDIWVQTLPAGPPIRVTTDPAQDTEANMAPDGSSVVFRSERGGGGIYLTKLSGSERLLARDGRTPRFSPDGGSIVYWVGDRDQTIASGQLFLLSLADGTVVRLAHDFLDARLPVWSSDGTYILFTGCRTGDEPMPACSEWWVTNRDGTRVQSTEALALLRSAQIQPVDFGGWYRNTILFSGKRGATTSLWELSISDTNLRARGEPQQLTSGEAREISPSLADNDTMAFEHLTGALHVWRLDHASNPKALVVTKVTQDAAVDLSPNISRDGRWLAFSRGSGNLRDIWLKDMQSETESLLLSSSLDKLSPVIDDSGETVAFEQRDRYVPSLFTVTRGQLPRKLCTGCSNPTGWFDGDRAVLYREGIPSKIKMFDSKTGETTIALEAGGLSLDDASWSPANQYLLFTATKDGSRKQVFAVSFPRSAQAATGEWIPITSESEFSYRPRWSGDGKTIFYLSKRDGFSCVWGQHFDTGSGRITPKAFAVMHYHNPRFSPATVAERSLNLSVSGDSIFLNVGETNGSIWTGVLKRRGPFSFLDKFR